MLTVHIRVNDEATKRPVPVWLRITDETGRYYPPLGRLAEFATASRRDVGGQVKLGYESYAFIDGTCEARLPAGLLTVQVERGPEYNRLMQQVRLAEGQLSLRLNVSRWTDHSALGWFSGDTRAHELTPQAAALEGAASGLAVVQVLARERPSSETEPGGLTGLLEFSGDKPALEMHGCSVAVNTLNEHPVLGTVGLLNSHRPVFPVRFGAPGLDDWSIADWCDQCHRKKGLVVWPDLPRLTNEHPQGETLAALILGKVDAFEIGPISEPNAPNILHYHRLLDCGLRPALVGGSGKDSNAVALGGMRTYARLQPVAGSPLVSSLAVSRPQDTGGEPASGMTASAWIEAVRARRTFITTAPLLSLAVGDQGPGSVVRAEPGTRLRLRAEAHSAVPFDYLDILVNGEVQVSKTASGNRISAVIEADLICQRSAWVAAVCYSREQLRSGACVFAHTSAVHIEMPSVPLRPSSSTAAPLLAILSQTRQWVEREARTPTEKHRAHLLAVLDEGRDRLQRSVAG